MKHGTNEAVNLATSLEIAPDVVAEVIAPMLALPTFGRQEIMAAHRRGEDVDQLVADFWPRYDAAWAEMKERAAEVAKRLNVAPCVVWEAVWESDAFGAAIERRTPPHRWDTFIPRSIQGPDRVRAPYIAPSARTARPRARQHRQVRRRKLANSTSSGNEPSDPEPPGGGQPRRQSEPKLIGEILAGYLERVLKRTGPTKAHDGLVARRIAREVFGDETR
jgi:hypothetical protein